MAAVHSGDCCQTQWPPPPDRTTKLKMPWVSLACRTSLAYQPGKALWRGLLDTRKPWPFWTGASEHNTPYLSYLP